MKKDTTTLISKQYDFNADGSLKFVDDMLNAMFDRSYKYDQMGRTVEAKAGTAARGETPTGPHNLDQPYSRQYSHNAFGQITSFNGFFYGSQSDYNVSFTNGRNPQWTYDADGNVLADIDGSFEFDAAGRLVKTTATDVDDEQVYLAPTEDHFDGNGQVAKRVRNAGSTDPAEIVNYFISSSVLGRVVSETNGTGAKLKTFVQANGALLAEQVVTEYGQTSYEILRFLHQDASGTGVQQTLADGTLAVPNARTAEYDAMGRNVADPGPYVMLNTQLPSENGSGIDLFGNGEGYRPGRITYTHNGMVVPESYARELINSGEIGGAFGLLQIAARMSIRGEGEATTFDPSEGEVDDETPSEWRDYDTSWTVLTSIIPFVQTQNSFVDDLMAFNTANPDCIKRLKELGLTDIEHYLDQAAWWGNDASSGTRFANQTVRELGFQDLSEADYDLTMSEFAEKYGATAVANIATKQVYYFDEYFNTKSPISRGGTIVHEAIHLALRQAAHPEMLKSLGIELNRKLGEFTNVDTRRDSRNVPTFDLLPPIYLGDNYAAAATLNAWLESNCGVAR